MLHSKSVKITDEMINRIKHLHKKNVRISNECNMSVTFWLRYRMLSIRFHYQFKHFIHLVNISYNIFLFDPYRPIPLITSKWNTQSRRLYNKDVNVLEYQMFVDNTHFSLAIVASRGEFCISHICEISYFTAYTDEFNHMCEKFSALKWALMHIQVHNMDSWMEENVTIVALETMLQILIDACDIFNDAFSLLTKNLAFDNDSYDTVSLW